MPGTVVVIDPSAKDKDGNLKNSRRPYADGKPRYRVRWHSVFDKAGKHAYRYKTLKSKADAEHWIKLMERADRSDTDDADEADAPLTFAQFVETWRATRLAGLAPKTKQRYEIALRCYLLPAFGTLPLDAITRQRTKTYFNELARGKNANGKPMSAGTLKKVVTVASSVMSEAVDLEYVAVNPFARLNAAKSIQATATDAEELDPFTASDIDNIADAIPDYRVAILTAGHAGPRASELWALRVRDCDLEHAKGPQIHIRRAIARAEGTGAPQDGPLFKLPKNGKTRVVRIPDPLADELGAHIAALADQDPDRLVFAAPGGGLQRHGLFMSRRFRPALKTLGIRPRPFHQLRHSFASMLIADGANDQQVQAALGHSDARSTAIYSHLFEGHDDDLLARRSAAWAARKSKAAA